MPSKATVFETLQRAVIASSARLRSAVEKMGRAGFHDVALNCARSFRTVSSVHTVTAFDAKPRARNDLASKGSRLVKLKYDKALHRVRSGCPPPCPPSRARTHG